MRAADPEAPSLRELGKRLFFDVSLSASGRIACASCHDPAHAYGPPDGKSVARGGADLQTPGLRAVPSLRYTLGRTPVWSRQFPADPLERIVARDSAAVGGFGWDGRFDSLRAQAAAPLLGPAEMGNRDQAEVVARLARAPYAAAFRRLFGADVFTDPAQAFQHALRALEDFELHDASLQPFSSKYDAYLDGKAQLSAQEARGLRWFNDPRKGNCNSCHLSGRGADGSHPLFTDFSFAALGVPRNPELPANADAGYFDLGLCGPVREDQRADTKACGMFKTPTLRNVATRATFFHNGRVHSLRDAVRFYAERDLQPSKWYARRNGTTQVYDDLPPELRSNVDHVDGPFDRAPGEPARLSEREIDDVVAFLRTLTDADAEPAASGRR